MRSGSGTDPARRASSAPMKHSLRLAFLVAVLTAALAACGTAADSPDQPGSSPPAGDRGDVDGVIELVEGSAGGPGIGIDEAIDAAGADPLLVNGALFVDRDGTVLLCSAIAESFPPQCGGTRLRVSGLDVASLPDLQEANGVRWVEALQLFGIVTPSAG